MQAKILLWASKAVMADSQKLFLYKIIHFSSQKHFEPKCGGSFQWTSAVLSVTQERQSADSGFSERAHILKTAKTNAQISE